MPVMACNDNGRPGWKWGSSGHCYTYLSGDKKASGQAKLKAYKQGAAITGGSMKEKSNLELGVELFLLESKLINRNR